MSKQDNPDTQAEEQAQAAAQAEAEPATEAPEAEATPVDETAELLKQLDALQAQVQEAKDERLRARAEMDNFRKRVQRDKDELRKTATAGLVEDLLPVLDNMKLGLQSAAQHPEAKVVTQGFEMVLSQLSSALEAQGLKELNPVGEAFDPNFHDCISQQPSDEVEADKVISVIRAGYQLGERLLRPANVVVSSGKAQESTETPKGAPEQD